MSRIAQKFRRTELVRAIKAAEAANAKVSGVEIRPDGTLSILFGQSDALKQTDLDKWLEDNREIQS